MIPRYRGTLVSSSDSSESELAYDLLFVFLPFLVVWVSKSISSGPPWVIVSFLWTTSLNTFYICFCLSSSPNLGVSSSSFSRFNYILLLASSTLISIFLPSESCLVSCIICYYWSPVVLCSSLCALPPAAVTDDLTRYCWGLVGSSVFLETTTSLEAGVLLLVDVVVVVVRRLEL